MTSRVLKVSTSGYYGWRNRPASGRDLEQAHLINTIRQVHAASYGTYGHRRDQAAIPSADLGRAELPPAPPSRTGSRSRAPAPMAPA